MVGRFANVSVSPLCPLLSCCWQAEDIERNLHSQVVRGWNEISDNAYFMEGMRSALCFGITGCCEGWRCYGKWGRELRLVKVNELAPTADHVVPVEAITSRDLIRIGRDGKTCHFWKREFSHHSPIGVVFKEEREVWLELVYKPPERKPYAKKGKMGKKQPKKPKAKPIDDDAYGNDDAEDDNDDDDDEMEDESDEQSDGGDDDGGGGAADDADSAGGSGEAMDEAAEGEAVDSDAFSAALADLGIEENDVVAMAKVDAKELKVGEAAAASESDVVGAGGLCAVVDDDVVEAAVAAAHSAIVHPAGPLESLGGEESNLSNEEASKSFGEWALKVEGAFKAISWRAGKLALEFGHQRQVALISYDAAGGLRFAYICIAGWQQQHKEVPGTISRTVYSPN